MRVKLSLMGDMCMPRPALLSVHDWPCVEMPTPMMWMPGFALQQNKLTKTVFHKSQFMALEGHDCGYWIPHLWLPPLPPLPILAKLPLIIAFSKRKVMFSSSTVKAEDSQIACTQVNSTVPLPMLTCASPVPLPSTFPAFNGLHNVSVNLTAGDLVAGIFSFLLTMACDALGATKWMRKGLDGVFKELVGAPNFNVFCLKIATGILVGAARIAATQDGDLKLEAFSAYAGGKIAFGGKRDGRLEFSAQGQRFNGTGTTQSKASLSKGNGRTVSESATTTVDWNKSRVESTTDRSYNSGEKEHETRTILSRGSVDPAFDGKTANSYTKTVQVKDTAPSKGASRFSSGFFQGTSNAQGDWGEAL